MRLVFPAAVLLALTNAVAALAEAPVATQSSNRDWVVEEINGHRAADFNQRCGPLDPIIDGDDKWAAACRTIQADHLKDILLGDNLPREGVRLIGARIEGNLDLANGEIKYPLRITGSRIDGNVNLTRAHLGAPLILDRSRVVGPFFGEGLRAENDLSLRGGALFKDRVTLDDVNVAGNLDLESSIFEKSIYTIRLHVGRSLLMNNKAEFKGEIALYYATIDGNLELEHSTFEKTVNAEGLKVAGHLFMGLSTFHEAVNLPFVHVLGNLDLSAGTFSRIVLSGAIIGQELRLCGPFGVAKWQSADKIPPEMTLRNTQARILRASNASWPDTVDLDGFGYDLVGGDCATTAIDTSSRPVEEWIRWLRKSSYPGKSFNPQPYTHLAKLFAGAGARDQAQELQFAAREAEREDARTTGHWRQWVWLSVLRWLCGYGVGNHTFIVLGWVAGSLAVGVLVLTCAQAARAKGVLWCVGASLQRLLPIVELNKEFSDFLYDPQRQQLRGWQLAFFALYALWGWVLGLLLLAAMSGLTQNS